MMKVIMLASCLMSLSSVAGATTFTLTVNGSGGSSTPNWYLQANGVTVGTMGSTPVIGYNYGNSNFIDSSGYAILVNWGTKSDVYHFPTITIGTGGLYFVSADCSGQALSGSFDGGFGTVFVNNGVLYRSTAAMSSITATGSSLQDGSTCATGGNADSYAVTTVCGSNCAFSLTDTLSAVRQ